MQILGGVVRYEDGIKTVQGDQYSPTRKVAVELNFTLDAMDANGSSDPAIQLVLDKAEAFVNGKLGIARKTVTAVTTVKPEEPKPEVKPDPKPRAPRAPAAPKPDELVTKDDLAKAAGVDKKINGKNEDALELSAKPKDDISDILAPTEKPISDADLNDAAQKTMARISTPENPGGPRIRAEIAKFLPEGAQPALVKVPQDKRAALLTAWKELK